MLRHFLVVLSCRQMLQFTKIATKMVLSHSLTFNLANVSMMKVLSHRLLILLRCRKSKFTNMAIMMAPLLRPMRHFCPHMVMFLRLLILKSAKATMTTVTSRRLMMLLMMALLAAIFTAI